jgi:hypothetical protein
VQFHGSAVIADLQFKFRIVTQILIRAEVCECVAGIQVCGLIAGLGVICYAQTISSAVPVRSAVVTGLWLEFRIVPCILICAQVCEGKTGIVVQDPIAELRVICQANIIAIARPVWCAVITFLWLELAIITCILIRTEIGKSITGIAIYS